MFSLSLLAGCLSHLPKNMQVGGKVMLNFPLGVNECVNALHDALRWTRVPSNVTWIRRVGHGSSVNLNRMKHFLEN